VKVDLKSRDVVSVGIGSACDEDEWAGEVSVTLDGSRL
jgi:hypothetical protein